MIQIYREVVCDECNAAIGHYIGSIEYANRAIKSEGAIVKGRRHFCDQDCLNLFKNDHS